MRLRIAALGLLGTLAAGCDSTSGDDPCRYIDCSSRGYCHVVDGAPRCECIAGFHAVGLTCVSDAPGCGDGWADPGEECDDGNTVSGDGCESSCRFSCHADAECDDEDPCTADVCEAATAGRRCAHTASAGLPCDDGNPCTEPDACTLDPGGSAHCAGGPNHCTCETAAECAVFEDGDLCNGTLDCIERVCAVDPATVVVCDPGTDTACAHNRCDPASGTCRMRAEADGLPCDDGDWCTLTDTCSAGVCAGSGARCPLPCQTCNGTTLACEVAAGFCIIDGTCVAEGTPSPANPCQGCHPAANAYGWSASPAESACEDGVWCNGHETCDGAGTCVPGTPPCPVAGCVAGCDEAGDRCVPASSATECRASTGPCDPAERCDGSSLTCPRDAFRPSTYECRAAAPGGCDVPEYCTGTSAACPPDAFRPSTYECRAAAPGGCDVPENCTGTSATCPPDAFRPSTYECRAAAPGGCDVPENCTGTSATCPPDAFRPSTYECRAAAPGGCDVPENCTGTSAVCPSDVFRPPSYECRPAAPGGCDVPENCTGTSAVCPSDARLPDGARCAFCRTCAAGTCTGFAALGADPGSDCPAIECDRYIYGWSGNSCVRYAASTAYNGGCNGAGACASVVQSCQGAGTSIHAGTCASAGCRNRTESSPCYPGASAPSAFGGACDYAGGPCFCDEDMHECVDPGDVCNPPAGSCGPPI